MRGEMTGEGGDDGAAAPRPEGAGDGSCDPTTGSGDGCACRLDGTRAQGVCGGSLGGAGELPAAAWHRPLGELLCGGDGPCRELGAQVSVDTTRTSSLSPFSSVQKLIHVRFAASRCLSAPQRPICFSPSSHSQLLLEHAAAAFPGPAARSRPFNPACCVENLSVCSLV